MQENVPLATSGSQRLPTDEEIAAFQVATRDLVSVAVRSVEVVAPGLSLPQFRLMLTLGERGVVSSAALAHELEVSPSSVTRMVDRLVASGHVDRGADADKRSAVALSLSPLGSRIVTEVLQWRHAELSRLLHHLDPQERQVASRGLSDLHAAVEGTRPEHPHLGGLPL